MIDLHCHILPGLDDGAANLEESVQMAQIARAEGIQKIVATPHFFRRNGFSEDTHLITQRYRELVQALETRGISLDLLLGAEVNISHDILEQIKKNRKNLTVNQGSYMFVEFPQEHIFQGVKELFFEIMTLRITPIIAHPERNFVFVDRPQLLYELVQMGALVQVNSRSFSGFYGSRVERALIGYLRGNLVHFLSSDGHNSGLRAPKLKEAFKIVEAIAGREYALAIVEANPRAVIENKLLPFLPDPISPEEKERSWKIRISSPFKWKP